MKKLCCFVVLCVLLLVIVPMLAFAQQEADSPYIVTNGRHQDFVEFEELVSGQMPWVRDRTLVPDYRAMYIAQANRFEAFLAKYPESPLKPEALFRIAAFYSDVEGQEVHMFRQQLFSCQGIALEQNNKRGFDLCEQKFMLNIVSNNIATDPVYAHLSREILKGLVDKYPHVKRYVKIGGEFRFDEAEEIGAIALYGLALGMIPQEKILQYKIIIQEYKIRPELKRDIQNRLEIE